MLELGFCQFVGRGGTRQMVGGRFFCQMGRRFFAVQRVWKLEFIGLDLFWVLFFLKFTGQCFGRSIFRIFLFWFYILVWFLLFLWGCVFFIYANKVDIKLGAIDIEQIKYIWINISTFLELFLSGVVRVNNFMSLYLRKYELVFEFVQSIYVSVECENKVSKERKQYGRFC